MGYRRGVTILPLVMLWAFPWRLAAQCPDGSPPPCGRPPLRAPSPNSVAVLYFDNLSRDTADAYLADGLTEEIIIRLGQIQRLDVKSRYEVQRYRGRHSEDPIVLGRALNAANLVTGSVQATGGRVRVRVELLQATTRSRVWGDVFDRSSGDVLAIEEEIARAVVQGIAGQMLPEERASLARRPTRSAAAYDLYLRGRAFVSRRDEPSLRRAIALFEQALTLDGGFASAEASIAEAWSVLADDWVAPRDAYPLARAAAERALRADSGIGAAWANLATVVYFFDWAPARAESLARRAIRLDPRSAMGHHIRGLALWHLASDSEAVEEFLRAYDLDSLSEEVVHEAVRDLTHERHFAAAVAVAERFQAAAVGNSLGFGEEARVYLAQHDCGHALPLLKHARALGDADAYDSVAFAYCEGHDGEARQLIAARVVTLEQRRSYFRAGDVAKMYVLVGDRDEAMGWLERAFTAREGTLTWLRSPVWDPLREDPQYADLLRRVGSTPVERH